MTTLRRFIRFTENRPLETIVANVVIVFLAWSFCVPPDPPDMELRVSYHANARGR